MTKIRKIWNNLPQEVKQFIFAWGVLLGSFAITIIIMALIFKLLNI